MSHSPDRRQPNARYDAAWDEINRKIRAGGSWSGHERNTFYLNGGRGRMFDLSAAMELDFPDDGRAFVRTDLDHDGDPDLVLKSRTAPQLRIVRNDLDILLPKRRGVVIRLIGTRGNREAVGAIVRAEVAQAGEIRWLTRSIGIGSGFLMQHSLEAFFGLGERGKIRTLTVTWPGGGETRLGTIEAGYRYTIEEGKGIVAAIPFRAPRTSPPAPLGSPSPRSGFALVSPYPAPPFTLPDLSGVRHTLPRKGRPLLLNFFATWCAPCKGEIADLERLSPLLASRGIETVLLSVDPLSEDFTPLPDETEVRKGVAAFVRSLGIDFPVLLADPDTAERYRIVSDGLCDHKRGLPLPLTLLIDEEGGIRKVYPGRFTFEEMRRDLETLDPWRNPSAAFPFPGRRVRYHFRRNDLWIGAAFARRDPQRFYADAKRAFERAITENPGVLPAWIDLATLELEAGHAQAARDTLVAARRRWPEEAEVAYRLGLACDRLGDTTAARRAYEAAIANDPTHARAHTNLGNLLLKGGDLAGAGAHYTAAVEAAPDFAIAWFNLAWVYNRQKAFDKAAEALERVIHLDPSFTEAYAPLARAYRKLGRRQRALEAFAEACRRNPEEMMLLHEYGSLALELGKPKVAQEAYRRAIERSPENAALYYNLGFAYAQDDQISEAIEAFEQAIRLQADFVEAYRVLGMIYANEGRLEAARRTFRRLLELEPDDPTAHDFFSREEGGAARTGAPPPTNRRE